MIKTIADLKPEDENYIAVKNAEKFSDNQILCFIKYENKYFYLTKDKINKKIYIKQSIYNNGISDVIFLNYDSMIYVAEQFKNFYENFKVFK